MQHLVQLNRKGKQALYCCSYFPAPPPSLPPTHHMIHVFIMLSLWLMQRHIIPRVLFMTHTQSCVFVHGSAHNTLLL